MKKFKIFAICLLIAMIIGAGVYLAMLRITVVYMDKEGNITNSEELGKFTLTFTGSSRYTDKELEEFFFEKDWDKNPIGFLFRNKFGEKIEIPFVETYDFEMLTLDSYKITFYEKSVVGYIKYMGGNMYFDKDGIVVESSSKVLEDVPLITGIDFDYIILHQKLPVENDKIFTILLEITQLIDKYKIASDKIYISEDHSVFIYVGKVKIALGQDDDMSEKVKALADILPNMVDEEGTLDMKEYNKSGVYTFKKA